MLYFLLYSETEIDLIDFYNSNHLIVSLLKGLQWDINFCFINELSTNSILDWLEYMSQGFHHWDWKYWKKATII